jgi:hypothetical protein
MVFNSLIFVVFFSIVLFLVFTDAYLRDLAGKTALLHLQPGAPPGSLHPQLRAAIPRRLH